MSTTDFLQKLDYDQLRFCRDKCDAMIQAIQAEKKKVAWAVTDGSINEGWFRTEDYLKAVACLVLEAEKRWAECDKTSPDNRYDLSLQIKGVSFPESEYNSLFADDQRGN